MSDFFRFEDEKIDFPFYNGNPLLSTKDWLILLAGVLVFIGFLIVPLKIDDNLFSVLSCLSVLIPSAYVCKGKLELLFRVPERKDLKLIIACFITYVIFSILCSALLEQIGLNPNENLILEPDIDLIFWIMLIVQLLGEELIKVSIFLIMMHVTFKVVSRKLSIILSTITALLIFGLMHYTAYGGAIVHILLVIGLGSFFYFYAYLKTKNVVVGYIVHVLIDGMVFFLSMID